MLWYFRHDMESLMGSLSAVMSRFTSAQKKKNTACMHAHTLTETHNFGDTIQPANL